MLKQHSLFGDPVDVRSQSNEYATKVQQDDVYAAIRAALLAEQDPKAATVLNNGGEPVTVAECQIQDWASRDAVDELIQAGEEHNRIENEIAAGRDPFADDYYFAADEAFDAIFECIRIGDDPDTLEFTAFHSHPFLQDFPNSQRTIKLRECTFLGNGHLTYSDLLMTVQTALDHETKISTAAEEEQDAALESFGQTPHPDDLTAPDYTVKADIAYDAMMDALNDHIDPIMVAVKTDQGDYVRLRNCNIRTISDDRMGAFELLKTVRKDWQDADIAKREEEANLVTDDWQM